jgi:uncharacterized protein (TIRG00374 family)
VKGKQAKPISGKILRWLIPLAMSGIAIWLVLRHVELANLKESFKKIGWQAVLLASIVYFIGFFFRVLCWYIIMRRKVSFKDAFFTMGAGYLLNNIFPFRLGEIGRALLLDDQEKHPALEVFSSIVVERVFDVFLATIFLLSTLPLVLQVQYNKTLIVIALVIALAGLVILYLLAKYQVRIAAWLVRKGERSGFIKSWVAPKASQLLKGLSVLTNPGMFMLAFGSLAFSWLIAFGENLIIFRRLYPNPPFWWMILVLSASAFGAAFPSAPAGLGMFEGVMVVVFALFGVDAELAFAHAIVIHALAFVYANAIGLIGLRMRGQALVDLYRRAVHRKPNLQVSE